MKKYFKYSGIFLALLVLIVSSCKKKPEKDEYANVKGNYFSIKQFALDEWNTYAGEPFMIVKTQRNNSNKTDSSMTNSDVIDWTPILKTFFDADISDRKFLGKYKFTQFDDNADATHNFFYETLDNDLFTQKLLITIDIYTAKVKGIYIETFKGDLFDDRTQKLYYKPLQTIQIQTDDKPLLGEKKHSVVQYDFVR